MANAKMTYAQAIDSAINGNINEEVVEKLKALKAQIEKRNSNGSGKKGLTKVQKENVDRKAHIYELLVSEPEGLTATEVGNTIAESCQRASALLHQMMDEGKVRQEKVGKAMRFYAVEADAEVVEGE